jgi:hypothetical protein
MNFVPFRGVVITMLGLFLGIERLFFWEVTALT